MVIKTLKNRSYIVFVALLTIIMLAIVLTHYYKVFKYRDNNDEVSIAISQRLGLDTNVTVIEMQKLNGYLIAFFRDESSTVPMYGFSRFQRGVNGRYRYDLSARRDIQFSSPILIEHWGMGKDAGLYYLIGGDNCESVEQFSLEFHNDSGEFYTAIFQNDTDRFFLLLPEADIFAMLSDDTDYYSFHGRYARLYDFDGKDITEMMAINSDFNPERQFDTVLFPYNFYRYIYAVLILYTGIIYVTNKVRKHHTSQG